MSELWGNCIEYMLEDFKLRRRLKCNVTKITKLFIRLDIVLIFHCAPQSNGLNSNKSTLFYLDPLCFMQLFPPKINVWILGFQCYSMIVHRYVQLLLNFELDPMHKSWKISNVRFWPLTRSSIYEVKLFLRGNVVKLVKIKVDHCTVPRNCQRMSLNSNTVPGMGFDSALDDFFKVHYIAL